MTIKQLLIILSCSLVLFLFIFNQDPKTSAVSKDAYESNTMPKQKNSQSGIELKRKKDSTESKAQDLSKIRETAKLVNHKPKTLKKFNDKSSQTDRENALKSVFGIEASVELDSDSESERVIFSVDREGIRSAVQEISGDLQECYDGWHQENPALEGRLQVSFVIEPAEAVNDELGQTKETVEAILSNVYLKVDEVKHPMMSACLLNLVEGLHFENVSSQVTVNYPFSFKAP